MHTPAPTYHPLVPPREIPRRHAESAEMSWSFHIIKTSMSHVSYIFAMPSLSCHNEVEAQLFSFLVCGKQDLFPRKGGSQTSYGNSYSHLTNEDYSDFDTDFQILRAGFLEYSAANLPEYNQEKGSYSKLRIPLGEGNKFLLSKYFQNR